MSPQIATQPRPVASKTAWRSVRLLAVCMRPHQWTKNLFVLAPLLFGGRLGSIDAVTVALCACAVFCLGSSALYILNDLIDSPADRMHPVKRSRPIASGELAPSVAGTAVAVFMTASLAAAFAIGTSFLACVLVYFVLTFSYCLFFKHVMIVDALLIAAGFVVRVASGALAIGVVASHWLIVCAFLLALYLAFAKRRHELLLLSSGAGAHRRVLTDYSVSYLDQVNNILLGAAIVCYALYTVAPDTIARFRTDALIYGTVFVVYGLLRYMALIQNGDHGGDPSRVAITDRPLMIAVFLWASYNGAIIYRSSFQPFLDGLR